MSFGDDSDLASLLSQLQSAQTSAEKISGETVDSSDLATTESTLAALQEAQASAEQTKEIVPISATVATAQPVASTHATATVTRAGFDFKTYFEKYKFPIIGVVVLIAAYFYFQGQSPSLKENPKGRARLRGGKKV